MKQSQREDSIHRTRKTRRKLFGFATEHSASKSRGGLLGFAKASLLNSRTLGTAALCVGCSVLIYLSLTAPVPTLRGMVRDDGFFYLQIARNFSRGSGSTFDCIQPTNGYHPLWMLCLAGLSSVLDLIGLASAETYFRVGLICTLALMFLSVYLALRIIRRLTGKDFNGWSKIILLIYMIAFPFSTAYLSDGFLVTALIALSLHEYVHERYRLAFILTPLVFLARIDLLPLALFFCAYTFYRDRREGAKCFLALAITVAIYLYTNLHFFGHFSTVSAYLKTQLWNTISPAQNAIAQLLRLVGRMGVLSVFFFASLLLYLFNAQKVRSQVYQKRAYNLLVIMATGGFLYISGSLFFNMNLRDWYFMWPLYLTGICVFAGLEIFKHNTSGITLAQVRVSSSKIAAGFMSFVILSAGACIVYIGLNRSWDRPNYAYALWLKDQVSDDEPVLQVDGAGMIGYFSGRKVISADGLVGSFDYARKLHSGRLWYFLRDNNIKYLAIEYHMRQAVIGDDDMVEYHGNRFKVTPRNNYKQEFFLYTTEPD